MEEKSVQKVLFITYDGLTDPLGQSQIIPYLLGIANSGVEITILSAEKKERQDSFKDVISQLADSGIKWHYIQFIAGISGKIRNLLSLKRKAVRLCESEDFSLVHCRSYVAGGIGYVLNRKFRLPYLFDIRGFWIDERIERGIWNLNNPIRLFAYFYYRSREKYLYRKAAGIITLTHSACRIIQKKFRIERESVSVIPCSADFTVFYPLSKDEKYELRSRLNIPLDAPVLSYSGSIGGVYLINEMLQFFRLMQEEYPGAWFIILTPEKQEVILNACNENGVDPNRVIIKYVKYDIINQYLNISDINIFLLKNSFSIEASMPTKLGEVWAAGIPVIANEISDLPVYFRNEVNGYLIPEINLLELKKAVDKINKLIPADRQLIREIAMNKFNLKDAIDMYLKAYGRIIRNNSRKPE